MNKKYIEIINCLNEFNLVTPKETNLIKNSFEFIENIQNSYQVSFDKDHAINVALWMAKNKFDYKAVIVGLLHELIPLEHDSNETLNNIMGLLNSKPANALSTENLSNETLTEIILSNLEDLIREKEIISLMKNYAYLVDIFKQAYEGNEEYIQKLEQYKKYPMAFYLIIAETIDVLKRNQKNDSIHVMKIAEGTLHHLMDIVKEINAYKIADEIEDLCLKIEQPLIYNKIRDIMIEESYIGYGQQNFINMCESIFYPTSQIIDYNLKKIQSCIKSFYSNKRSIISLSRLLNLKEFDSNDTDNEKFDILKNYKEVAYYDFTLVVSDDLPIGITNQKIFLKYYEYELEKNGVTILSYKYTSDGKTAYFIIEDKFENIYRFFIRSQKEYLTYVYGNIVEGTENGKRDYQLINLDYQNNMFIKVFKLDGTSIIMPKGSTVLDFAFEIHAELGIHCNGAYLNHVKKTVPISHKLNNGCYVEIRQNSKVFPDITWFRAAKTEKTVEELIKYLSKTRYRNDPKITVYTKDDKPILIPVGSTLLDFAFMVDEENALKFSYGVVSNSMSVNSFLTERNFYHGYKLKQGDHIDLKFATVSKVKSSWLELVTSSKAKRCIHKALEMKENIRKKEIEEVNIDISQIEKS